MIIMEVLMRKLTITVFLIMSVALAGFAAAEKESVLTAEAKNRPWFGIELENSLERKVEEIPNGALIKDVVPGSNAEKMELKKGDIVKQVDGKDVISVKDFINKVSQKKPGEEVTLKVFRNKENLEIKYVLENFHERANDALDKLGFDITTFDRDKLVGVIVTKVVKGSYADYKGLAVNDLILALDHSDFDDLLEFEMILSNIDLTKSVDMVVIRSVDNKQTIIPLKIGPEVEEKAEENAEEKTSSIKPNHGQPEPSH